MVQMPTDLVGKDEQGLWMTAPSATYPPDLSLDSNYGMACPTTPTGGGRADLGEEV